MRPLEWVSTSMTGVLQEKEYGTQPQGTRSCKDSKRKGLFARRGETPQKPALGSAGKVAATKLVCDLSSISRLTR